MRVSIKYRELIITITISAAFVLAFSHALALFIA
jgi:hypothetical protein